MSRGLGTLQQAILEAMGAHRALQQAILYDPSAWRGRVHVEDLRKVVARRLGRSWPEGHTRSFQAAFSRACRTLGARDLIPYEPYLGRGVVWVADEPDKR